MRKLFTLVALAAALNATATDYTGNLEVSINGEAVNQQAKITVEQQSNGLYTLQLHNFMLVSGSDAIAVGNIDLKDVAATTENGVTTLKFNDNITITEGDDASVAMWMGPMLGLVPVNMTGELRSDDFYTVINIDMSSTLGQVIRVTFGDGGYQIANAGFEEFHTATAVHPTDKSKTASSEEPNNWHSFQSATTDGFSGLFASFSWYATGVVHTYQSDEARPGSTGKHSVKITASTAMGSIIANGTMTTGRINAGSATADDTKNHSFLDMSKTDVDGNGDPFYTTLNGLPDSLAVWVKFKQGKADASYPYATVSAAITDGTYYQDPEEEDKTYSNVIAKAKNNTIESKDAAWQRISIPFTYNDVSDDMLNGTKALLVTISTNATPGKGSNGDELYVDDIELIYDNAISDIKVKGQSVGSIQAGVSDYKTTYEGTLTEDDITVDAVSKGVRVSKEITKSDDSNSSTIVLTVKSADLKQSTTYTITATSTTGITAVGEASKAQSAAIYNLAGQRIDNAKAGQVVIKKYADGKTVKAIK